MRFLGALLLLVALGFAQGEEGEAPRTYPNKVRLNRSRFPYKLRFNYALPAGRKAAEKPVVLKGRVDKFYVFFIDLDGNGKFNDLGVDAWALQGMNYVLPLEDGGVIELFEFAWRVEEDGKFVHWDKKPVPVDATQAKSFRQYNYWRLINGLPPVTVDPGLSKACAAHCAYMESNGMTHVQEDGKAGYTPEGAAAGLRSCLSEERPGMSILMFYSSFYHRLPLVHPGTKRIGIGNSRRYTALDGISKRDHRHWKWPVIVPAPSTDRQPTHFAREGTRPHPPDLEQPGLPITLTFDGGTVSDVKAQVRLKSAKGAPVKVIVTWPGNPANKKYPNNKDSILILPRGPLPPKRVCWVEVEYKWNGEPKKLTWLFRTGRPRPVHVIR